MICCTSPATVPSYVVIASESEVGDRLLERVDIDLSQRRQQCVVGKASEETVDDALEVRDTTLGVCGQPHVFETLGVQAFLLLRQVGEVLPWDGGPARIVRLPHLGSRRCLG